MATTELRIIPTTPPDGSPAYTTQVRTVGPDSPFVVVDIECAGTRIALFMNTPAEALALAAEITDQALTQAAAWLEAGDYFRDHGLGR